MRTNISGVIPAALTPWLDDFSLDKVSLERHLRHLLSTKGVNGVLVNGNTSEVASCSPSEQEEIIAVGRSCTSEQQLLISGIELEDAGDHIERALRSQALGVDALLVSPPKNFEATNSVQRNTVLQLWGELSEAVDLPLVLFQYPVAGGRVYPLDMLRRVRRVAPRLAGIKDFCCDKVMHRQTIALARDVLGIPVLTSHTRWLRESLGSGAVGVFSAAGSIFANEQARLLHALKHGSASEADAISLHLDRMMNVLSAPTLAETLPLLKVAAMRRGDFQTTQVRPPLVRAGQAASEKIGNEWGTSLQSLSAEILPVLSQEDRT